jgi:sn-glycerol 3-phosphate transport system ATP-binding protein
MEIWERPADTYVAGFIGSPSMNFLPATLEEGGSGALVLDGVRLAFGDGLRGGAPGRRLTLGIRPEHLRIEQGGIPFAVDLVEPLGSETVVHGTLPGGQAFTLRLAGHAPEGSVLPVVIPPEHLHVFDGESGVRLEPARQEAALAAL